MGVCCELQFADGSNVRWISSCSPELALTPAEIAAANANVEHGAASLTPTRTCFCQPNVRTEAPSVTVNRWIKQRDMKQVNGGQCLRVGHGCGSCPGTAIWQANLDELNAKNQLCKENVLNVLELAEAVAHGLCNGFRQGRRAPATGPPVHLGPSNNVSWCHVHTPCAINTASATLRFQHFCGTFSA